MDLFGFGMRVAKVDGGILIQNKWDSMNLQGWGTRSIAKSTDVYEFVCFGEVDDSRIIANQWSSMDLLGFGRWCGSDGWHQNYCKSMGCNRFVW